jgi:aryl-alcohol dehydrogenase-like predicted oxidoreductase
MTWSTDPFKHMDKDLKDREKATRKERKLEAQENARKLRTRDLKYVAEALDLRHASPHSRRVVLTGFHEYYRVINKHFDPKPEPAPTLDQAAPGLLLSAVVEQPVAWLWQDYLPLGALTLLEGEPGSGTSLLALHIAACVTSGRALPGGSPSTQGTVILVAGQDHPGYTIAPRFLAAGGDPARVLLLTTVEQVDSDKVTIEDRPFSLARDLHFLEEAVTRTNAALVILDSLDACRSGDLRQALPALAQLAQRTGCAILLVRPIAATQAAATHKPGSLELQAAVRSSLLIQSDPEDRQRQRLLIVTKHALCAQPPILSFQLTTREGVLALDWLGTYTHPMPFFEDSEMNLCGRNYSLLRQTILRTLQECAAPMNARSLTSITGFPYENVRKLLQRMVHAMEPLLVCPARGLYTTLGHPCLAQPAASSGTPPPEPPVPTVAPVPGEPEQAAARATPPQTPVSTVASVPTAPGTPPSPAPTSNPPAASSKPPAPLDEGPQRPIPPETPDPPVPASTHDPANDSPKPPVSALEVDAYSISTESPVPIIPIVPTTTPPGRGQPFLSRARNPLMRGNPECATLNSALAEESRQGGAMEYRTLGRTGWNISAIGFGAWGIGGSDWGSTDDTTSLAALHRAIDLGVNFIDTADVYGDGHSEQLIAQVRKARSEQLVIATKAGRRLNPHTAQGYTRQNLTAFVERSLRNLEMEALDLLQLHSPPSEVYDMPEVFGILDDLVQQGKIRYYGVSVERVDEALKAVSYPHVQSVQLIFNLFRLKPSEHFFAVARERQVGILARVPLASGLLTGKFRPDTHFAPNDHRSFNRHGEAFDQGETFSGVEYERGLQAVEELRPLVPQGATMAQFALRWILMFPEVTSAIPGGKNPQQVEENVNAAALPPLNLNTMIDVEAINDAYIWPQVHHRW